MKEQTALKKVADMARLADSYVSAWGDEAKVSEETLRRLLTSLGYDTSSDEKLLASAEKKHKKDVLAPVLVLRDGEPVEVELNLHFLQKQRVVLPIAHYYVRSPQSLGLSGYRQYAHRYGLLLGLATCQ